MKKIVKMIFGSHMYGLNTPDSDTDYKGIYLPELDELLLGNAAKQISKSTGNDKSKNSKDDIDDERYSLAEFVRLACKGETVALDMLHANDVELGEYGSIWEDLVSKRHMFYTKNLKAYMGYVKRQAAKYGLKGSRIAAMREAIVTLEEYKGRQLILGDIWLALPTNEFAKTVAERQMNGQKFYEVNGKKYQHTVAVDYALERITKALEAYGDRALLAEKNEGVDWKAVSHALRAGYQLLSIFENGTFSYPLKETDFLRGVKTGKYDYKTVVSPVLEQLVDDIEKLIPTVDLPEKVDQEYWDKWLLKVYDRHLIDPYAFPEGH